MSKPPNTSYRG